MSPRPMNTRILRSFEDLSPDLFTKGDEDDPALAQVISFMPRAEIEDESGDSDSTDPAAEPSETDDAAEPATDSEGTASGVSGDDKPRRILVRDMIDQLIAAGIDPDAGAALQRIRDWYASEISGGDQMLITAATQARKELREAVAEWVATAHSIIAEPEVPEEGAEGSDEAAVLVSSVRLTVEEAKAQLMEHIVMARNYGGEDIMELANQIYTLGMKLGVDEDRLFRIGKGDEAYSPSREELDADADLRKKAWYYTTAFWMSREEREPEEFLAEWFWPGTKPKPERTREPRSREVEATLPSPPPLPVTQHDPVSPEPDKGSEGAEPVDAGSGDGSSEAEVLDPERQFRVHRTGETLVRLEGESDEGWDARTKAAVKAARRAARSGDSAARPDHDQAGSESASEPVESLFSTGNVTTPPAPVKSVGSLPGGGVRITREDGSSTDRPYDWQAETDEPEGSDDSADRPDAAALTTADAEPVFDWQADAELTGDEPASDALEAEVAEIIEPEGADGSDDQAPNDQPPQAPPVLVAVGVQEATYRSAVDFYRENPTASVADVLAGMYS